MRKFLQRTLLLSGLITLAFFQVNQAQVVLYEDFNYTPPTNVGGNAMPDHPTITGRPIVLRPARPRPLMLSAAIYPIRVFFPRMVIKCRILETTT